LKENTEKSSTPSSAVFEIVPAKVSGKYSMFLLVGFDVLTAVVMKSTIFWDITPCSLLSVNRRFGGTYSLHLQGALNGLHGVIYQKMVLFMFLLSHPPLIHLFAVK
jgi:hypothetical protein